MSDDIVEQLREEAKQYDGIAAEYPANLRGAADEIEKLRAALAHCGRAHHCDVAAAALAEEDTDG